MQLGHPCAGAAPSPAFDFMFSASVVILWFVAWLALSLPRYRVRSRRRRPVCRIDPPGVPTPTRSRADVGPPLPAFFLIALPCLFVSCLVAMYGWHSLAFGREIAGLGGILPVAILAFVVWEIHLPPAHRQRTEPDSRLDPRHVPGLTRRLRSRAPRSFPEHQVWLVVIVFAVAVLGSLWCHGEMLSAMVFPETLGPTSSELWPATALFLFFAGLLFASLVVGRRREPRLGVISRWRLRDLGPDRGAGA